MLLRICEPRKRMTQRIVARFEAILKRKYAYVDSLMFEKEDIERDLFDFNFVDGRPLPCVDGFSLLEKKRNRQEEISGIPPLDKSESRLAFLQYNYSKRKLIELQHRVGGRRVRDLSPKLASEIIRWDDRVQYLRGYIFGRNLGLVGFLWTSFGHQFENKYAHEAISEANLALLRSIEKFNVDRGFLFSTYACRAIIKSFTRLRTKIANQARRVHAVEYIGYLSGADLGNPTRADDEGNATFCLEVLRKILAENAGGLSGIERKVITLRFNLNEGQESELTLEQTGKCIGLTKERIRQIQNKAIEKLGESLKEVLNESDKRSH